MKLLRNERGLTLAELLATLAIGSLVVVFIMSIHIMIQKQYSNQSKDSLHLTDVTIAAKVITKEIRSSDVEEANGTKIIFVNGNSYELENNTIKKNDTAYIYDIDVFEVNKSDGKVTLKIISTTGQRIKTEVFIRGREIDE